MAEVLPFRGILYNPQKIRNLSDIATPPYDVISKQEQNNFYERHPQNIVRLILGKTTEKDTVNNNCYTRASDFLKNWFSENILVQDTTPAFYLTSMDFSLENKTVTRYGIIALVALEPFENGVILPHETTFSNVKMGRFELMKSCHANFSPIFSLYSDNNNIIIDKLKGLALKQAPVVDFTDYDGQRHRMWRITDLDPCRYVSNAMQEKRLFIADGHHRYETALSYRDWIASNNPDFKKDHPANYVMMYLSGMEDDGLAILPAHRMVKGLKSSMLGSFINKAEHYFDILTIPFRSSELEGARAEFISILKSNASKNIIGVLMKGSMEFYLLTLKSNVMERMFSNEVPEALRYLDVTVLTRLIFIEILGFDNSKLDNENIITYSSSEKQAIEAAVSGKCDISFILNPTKIEQVRDIANKGLIMPRKSTYFYPKVITGLVMNSLTA
ncbi:MAG: DUF1015 domain-containing protein [Deltaproteobacteria bacterium]|nr:DUF1015 domain-containing protein [Deltaproteobacteria bacterium]